MSLRGRFEGELTIVLAGEAGQGVQTIEQVLDRVLLAAGYHVFSTGEFMSRIRGGCNSTLVRVSEKPCSAAVDRIDILVPLDEEAIPHLARRITDNTIIIADTSRIKTDRAVIDVPISKTAAEVGGKIYENTVAAGVLLGLIGIEPQAICDFLHRFFGAKSQDIVEKNCEAARRGVAIAKAIGESGAIPIAVRAAAGPSDNLLLTGVDALSLGAMAGGCNFVSSYPMSPSTGVLTFLAQQGRDFGVVVEQAEDEIAAINMTLGAWYAGARGMVTTSGGGFALMCEGVSLAGMIETPIVIHIGQRPGPATGLPTRTEQGDLELALYSGHGEFPRIILAPGTLEDAFILGQKAFNLADRFQVPVFLLTDQYLLDSYAMTRPFDVASTRVERHVVRTGVDYKRYALTPDGISPRGIPAHGEGIVAVDSDEHTEAGYITEDASVRVAMSDKRLRKQALIMKEIVPPRFVGPEDYDTMVVCWGSTIGVVEEVVRWRPRTAALHFTQVFPIDPCVASTIAKAQRTIIVENNATAQFARLLKLHAGVEFTSTVLKYDGHPFSVEELSRQIG